MRKRIAAVIILTLLLISRLSFNSYATDPDLDQFLHRSNVVFVTDESGSMKQTDPYNNRYEAIRLFLGEMANEGNYVGSVSFGEQLVDSSNISAINGQKAKDALLADISDQKYSNYTNIGRGLIEAVNMLDSGRNKDLDSAIILLTDGNTDMPNDDLYNESINMKAEAIDRARKAGYKIFTICLNVNGAADSKEMRQIAEATGGEFAEVTSAEDLNDVETMFNKLIFNSFEDMDFANLELVIGGDGTVSTDFDIPGVGVEEINVLFQGSLAACELIDPSGKHYKGGTDGAVLVDGADFLLIKVQRPVGGIWQAVAFGDPNTVIRLRLLYNSNFYVVASLDAPSEIHVGDTVRVIANIGTSSGIETDTSRYSDMTATATVTFGDQINDYPMRISQQGFEYEMNVAEEGTYYISVKAANKDMEDTADEVFEINVNNTAPVFSGKELSAHANVWPILGGAASVDLTDAATDPEGQPITYTVESSAFSEEDYSLDGTKLTVKKFSIPKGSFTIKASDPYGAYCTFDARFTSTNIGIIMAILTAVGIVIALVAVALVIHHLALIPLVGQLSVASYEGNRKNAPQVVGNGRGQIPLSRFYIGESSLPPGCKFQCDGNKAQVWFISKKPVYTDNAMGSVKKIRVNGDGMEVRVSADEKMEKGIIISFKSDKLNSMGMPY